MTRSPELRMVSMKDDLPDKERKAANAVISLFDVFADIRGTIPLQYARAFMMIARDEGKTVGYYAEKSNVSLSVMSRHVLDLSDSSRRVNEPGMDLVYSKINPLNRREHLVFLTPKGRATFHRVLRHMEH